MIKRRRAIAERYNQNLEGVDELFLPPSPDDDAKHYDVYQNYEIEAYQRDLLKEFLLNKGIGTMVQWGGKGVHQLKDLGFDQSLPFTEKLMSKSIMLPINMFKVFDLMSVKKSKIIRKVFSSGTSGELSKIFLDKENSNNQMKVLTKIMKNILGNERLPMLIIDQDPLSNRKQNFNAKSAAIFGFSLFGKNHCYILDKNKNIKLKLLKSFLKKYKNKKFIIFGFTSQIFEYLLKKKTN